MVLPFVILAMPACGVRPQTGYAEYNGLFELRFERSAFKPCGSDEEWWAEFWTGDDNDIFKAMGVGPGADLDRADVTNRLLRVWAEVKRQSELTPGDPDAGVFGHMSAYRGRIRIRELVEARDATPEEIATCSG